MWCITKQNFHGEKEVINENLSGPEAMAALQLIEDKYRKENPDESFKRGVRLFRMVKINGSSVVTFEINRMP